MVPRQTLVSQNFGPISKFRKRFLCVSKSETRFWVIFAPRSLEFFFCFMPEGVSDLSFFRLSVWSSEVDFFRDHGYSLSN